MTLDYELFSINGLKWGLMLDKGNSECKNQNCPELKSVLWVKRDTVY